MASSPSIIVVMAGLFPAIHVFERQDMDARHKARHDENGVIESGL
jgi:hypothetical protein